MSDIYGLHLTAMLRGVDNVAALDDERHVERFLLTLVNAVGMRVLAGPMCGRESASTARSGVSGVVILYESHAAIHTYPHLGIAFLDMFSCSEYGPETVFGIFEDFFGKFQIAERATKQRGVHWGIDLEGEFEKWEQTR